MTRNGAQLVMVMELRSPPAPPRRAMFPRGGTGGEVSHPPDLCLCFCLHLSTEM